MSASAVSRIGPQALTVRDVVELTVPDGLSAETWQEVLTEAAASAAVWADPWVSGSEGWAAFLGGEPKTGASVAHFRNAVGQECCGLTARILTVMADYAERNDGRVFPSNSTVALSVGTTRETVNRALRRAVEDGWLHAVGRRGRGAMEYRLAIPAVSDRAA